MKIFVEIESDPKLGPVKVTFSDESGDGRILASSWVLIAGNTKADRAVRLDLHGVPKYGMGGSPNWRRAAMHVLKAARGVAGFP